MIKKVGNTLINAKHRATAIAVLWNSNSIFPTASSIRAVVGNQDRQRLRGLEALASCAEQFLTGDKKLAAIKEAKVIVV